VAHSAGMRIGDVQAAAAAATMGDRRVHRITLGCDGSIGYEPNMEILFRAQAAALAHDPAIRDVPVVVDILYVVSDDDDDDDMGYLGISGGGQGERGGTCTLFVRPYLDLTSTNGTGCTLSAALACALPRKKPCTHFSHLAVLGLSNPYMSHASVIEAVS